MIFVKSARHVKDYQIAIEFSDGAAGVIDLHDTVHHYNAAAQIRDPEKFAEFYLDAWPTLAWKCGFDLSPEYLYQLLTGADPNWVRHASDAIPLVAEEKPRYGI
jgi:hypothetical protein